MVEMAAKEDSPLIEAQIELGQPQPRRDLGHDRIARIVPAVEIAGEYDRSAVTGKRIGQRLELSAIHIRSKLEVDGVNIGDREGLSRPAPRVGAGVVRGVRNG